MNKIFALIILLPTVIFAGDRDYLYYPEAPGKWEQSFALGLSVTKLPIEIVEEEINQSPILRFDYRLGLPMDFWVDGRFYSNYFANYGQLGFGYSLLGEGNRLFGAGFDMALGIDCAGWFGHLDMDAIQLKARGGILTPYISFGLDYDDVLLSARFESQSAIMWTDNGDEEYLGRTVYPRAGTAVTLMIEQPLWNNHWTVLGLKLNYSCFYYQSWLSYSTLDEYLIYPEIIFSFIL